MTALTETVTLSRVITSCGGTSMVTVRKLTLTMRSIGRNTRITPGPLAAGRTRPSLKITPRSYSGRILIELKRYSAIIRITITGIDRNCVWSIACLLILGYLRRLAKAPARQFAASPAETLIKDEIFALCLTQAGDWIDSLLSVLRASCRSLVKTLINDEIRATSLR